MSTLNSIKEQLYHIATPSSTNHRHHQKQASSNPAANTQHQKMRQPQNSAAQYISHSSNLSLMIPGNHFPKLNIFKLQHMYCNFDAQVIHIQRAVAISRQSTPSPTNPHRTKTTLNLALKTPSKSTSKKWKPTKHIDPKSHNHHRSVAHDHHSHVHSKETKTLNDFEERLHRIPTPNNISHRHHQKQANSKPAIDSQHQKRRHSRISATHPTSHCLLNPR